MTSKVVYNGDLRTTSTHLQSGVAILSDAPKDNHGRGEAFSPTDLVANSLATCMFSIMGIKAKALQVDLSGSTATVTKTMQAEPRKIARIDLVFEMTLATDAKTQTILERAALACPVYLSLHPDVEKNITFHWR